MTIKRRCLLAWIKTLVCKFFVLCEFCHRCGVRQPLVWWCDNHHLWSEVTGCHENGIVCPKCFDELAKKRGLMLKWHPRIERR